MHGEQMLECGMRLPRLLHPQQLPQTSFPLGARSCFRNGMIQMVVKSSHIRKRAAAVSSREEIPEIVNCHAGAYNLHAFPPHVFQRSTQFEVCVGILVAIERNLNDGNIQRVFIRKHAFKWSRNTVVEATRYIFCIDASCLKALENSRCERGRPDMRVFHLIILWREVIIAIMNK